jgi:hypothetical protein
MENYSRHLANRQAGDPPETLVHFFKKSFGEDWLLVVDESHVTLPQIGGMWGADRARKVNLVNHGFRCVSVWTATLADACVCMYIVYVLEQYLEYPCFLLALHSRTTVHILASGCQAPWTIDRSQRESFGKKRRKRCSSVPHQEIASGSGRTRPADKATSYLWSYDRRTCWIQRQVHVCMLV